MRRDQERDGIPHVLLIYRAMIPSVVLCGHCQLEYLHRQGLVEYRGCQEQALNAEILNWADVVVLARLDSWYEKRLVSMLRTNGKYLIYMIDDDLLNVPDEVSSAPHYQLPEIRENIRTIMAMSDAILSPSPLLLEKYAQESRMGILLEEPALYEGEFKHHDSEKALTIGFAGSLDRVPDVEHLLKDVLFRLKAEYGDRVCISFFGAVPSFADDLHARKYPYCGDYNKYLDKLAELEWDIGLAPMPGTDFHIYKHYIKYIEYASTAAAVVMSDAGPYRRLKERSAPAIFCENTPDSWYHELRMLIECPERLTQLRQNALRYTKMNFSLEKASEALYSAISAAYKTEREVDGRHAVPYHLTVNKLLDFIHTSYFFVKKYKLNTPKMLLRKLMIKLS